MFEELFSKEDLVSVLGTWYYYHSQCMLVITNLLCYCSWLVLRSQWKDPGCVISQVDEGANAVCSVATDWCEEAEDWGRLVCACGLFTLL